LRPYALVVVGANKHPTTPQRHNTALRPQADKYDKRLLAEHFEELRDDEDDTGSSEDEGGSSGDDDDAEDEREGTSSGDEDGGRRRPGGGSSKRKGPSMYVAKDAVAAAAFRRGESLAGAADKPLGARVAEEGGSRRPGGVVRVGGSREITFNPGGGRFGRGGGRGGPRGAGRAGGRGVGRGARGSGGERMETTDGGGRGRGRAGGGGRGGRGGGSLGGGSSRGGGARGGGRRSSFGTFGLP